MSQDNRVPKIIQDFVGQPSVQSVLSFLAFEDWVKKRENDAADWVVVARSWRDDTTDFFTFSVLGSVQEDALKKILSTNSWDIDTHIGHPMFNRHGEKGFVYYSSNDPENFNGLQFLPFTIHREFHGYIPNTFEITQDFILYHEAFYVPEKNEYHRITDDGDIQPLIRIIRDKENQTISIETHHLRDYLAAKKCYLVRYHDHRRFATDDVGSYINGKFASYQRGDERSKFEFWLRTDIPFREYKSSSRLLGKDVVIPYSEPDKQHTNPFSKDRYGTFIIGRDDQGNELEATCNEDELSNYFTNRETPHFLTAVYFSREVLGKYYQEPRRYSLSQSYLKCLSLWSIPFDTTSEGLIQVWLGDLGRIPYREQLHWRQFNVTPKGTITKHRWMRDFMAEFADPELDADPIYYFHAAFNQLQEESKKRYNEEFLNWLSDEDSHAYETLHLPLTDEWKEFDEQVQALTKIVVDSLNVELLSRESGVKIDGKTIKGSIDLLGMFLDHSKIEEGLKLQILSAFQAIQAIRSTGSAHRKGSKFEKALEKYELFNLSNFEKFKKLTLDIINAISAITEIIHQKSDDK